MGLHMLLEDIVWQVFEQRLSSIECVFQHQKNTFSHLSINFIHSIEHLYYSTIYNDVSSSFFCVRFTYSFAFYRIVFTLSFWFGL